MSSPSDTAGRVSPPTGGVLCPYCGVVQSSTSRCVECRGLFEPLSRQATQNAMGPWQIRSDRRPFQPGCSWETLREMVGRGRIGPETVLRGPTTRQFWTFARDTPSIAVLLGMCHSCHAPVRRDASACGACGVELLPRTDRQHLGLSPVQLLPGDAPAAQVATVAVKGASGLERPATPLDAARGPEVAAGPAPGSEDERPGLVRRLRREAARARRSLAVSLVANVVLASAVIGGTVWFFATGGDSTWNAPGEGSRAPEAVSGAAAAEGSSDEVSELAPEGTAPAAEGAETTTGPRRGLIPGLDPGLERFAPDFLRAMELREEGTEASLAQAVEILEGIAEDAAAEGSAAEGVAYPELERTLRDVRAELDDAVLRSMF